MDRAGAIAADIGQDLAVYQPQGKSYAIDSYKPEPEALGTMYVQSRALLEHCIRQRVEALPNVTARYGTRVDELMGTTRDVVGVVTAGGEHLEADLVVDATGRNSHTARWLEQLGYAKPRESVVNCDFAYSSVFLRPRDPQAVSEVVTLVVPSPLGDHSSRLGALIRLENDIWLAGLAGRYGDFPPADWQGFRSFGKSLPYSIWDELVETAEPVTPPAPSAFPAQSDATTSNSMSSPPVSCPSATPSVTTTPSMDKVCLRQRDKRPLSVACLPSGPSRAPGSTTSPWSSSRTPINGHTLLGHSRPPPISLIPAARVISQLRTYPAWNSSSSSLHRLQPTRRQPHSPKTLPPSAARLRHFMNLLGLNASRPHGANKPESFTPQTGCARLTPPGVLGQGEPSLRPR